jgi:hypothetical protein
MVFMYTNSMVRVLSGLATKRHPVNARHRFPAAVLADQTKSLDQNVQMATRKGKIFAEELADVRAKIPAVLIASGIHRTNVCEGEIA